jgi:hypothetical protein
MVRALLLLACVPHRLVRMGCELLIATLAISLMSVRSDASPYQPGDVDAVSGRVTRVETLARAGGGRDVTVVLETEIGDEVRVAVAPEWVCRTLGLRLREGDLARVVGWRIVRGKPALLAAEIVAGGLAFVLRDRYGSAVWGPRRRMGPPPAYRVDQPD